MSNRPSRANRPDHQAFRRLSRSDLTGFDDEATDLVMTAMEAGCVARVSSKGHCIMRNSTGGTASVPRNLSTLNRGAQNARSQVRRFMAEHHAEPGTETSSTSPGDQPPERMTVKRAFIEHGASFTSWFDEQEGLAPDQIIEAMHEADGTVSFEAVEDEKATTAVHTAKKTADPETTLKRIREVLGQDPRITELEAQVTTLQTELAQARAELTQANEATQEAQTRLGLIREAIRV